MGKRFIAVQHNWHVYSDGFIVHKLHSDNYNDAKTEAYAIQVKGDKRFSKCAVEIIEIRDTDSLVNRKLTIMERITGKLNPKI